MTVTNKRSLISLALVLVLVVSLFTVGFSAEETTGSATEFVEDVESESTTESAGSEKETESESVSETESETETEVDAAAEANAETTRVLIINGIIIGVIVIIGVVLCIRFRVKLAAFFRSVKSEMKKIVWSSKENTRKSFLVVMVVGIAIAVIIGLIDFAFNTGIQSLADLFH